jgi:hypothetical protein
MGKQRMETGRDMEGKVPSDEGDGSAEGKTPAEVGEGLGVSSSAESTSIQKMMTPHEFGTFAHQVYEAHAYLKFDDVENERSVRVIKPDGRIDEGKIDTVLNEGQTLIDYKTSDMRTWDAAQVRVAGRVHGQQMAEYIASPDTPADASGWVIPTVPPERDEVRQMYADRLAEYGVGVKFPESDQPEDVMDAVQSAVDEDTSSSIENTDKEDGLDG